MFHTINSDILYRTFKYIHSHSRFISYIQMHEVACRVSHRTFDGGNVYMFHKCFIPWIQSFYIVHSNTFKVISYRIFKYNQSPFISYIQMRDVSHRTCSSDTVPYRTFSHSISYIQIHSKSFHIVHSNARCFITCFTSCTQWRQSFISYIQLFYTSYILIHSNSLFIQMYDVSHRTFSSENGYMFHQNVSSMFHHII